MPFVTINGPRHYEYTSDGGSNSFTFSCNYDWRVSSTDSWVRISPSSGKASDGEINVTLTCDANTTYDSREAVLTFTVSDLEEVIFVKQTTKAVALVSPSSTELTAEAQKLEINVQVNTNWYPEVDYYSMGWIEPDPEIKKTKGLESFTMVFNISENKSGKDRTGKIYVKMTDGPTLATISVTQKARVVEVTSITLNKTTLTLKEDDAELLIATVKPDNATGKTVTWSSTNNEVATVDQRGEVVAIKQGSTTITAKAGEKTATCAVTVKGNTIEVTSVELNKTELYLKEGESETLVATVKPDDATDKTVTWSSSDANIATVDSNGKVTAVKEGAVTITAKAGGESASCLVSVGSVPKGAVDLGLSVYWATCNIGATSPEEYGDYYAWGETEIKTFYDWSTYKWCDDGSFSSLTKYNNSSSYGTVDNKTVLEEADDVALVKLGGKWRIPTEAEWKELQENCSWSRTSQNGVKGHLATSKINGISIFLPAAGYRMDDELYGEIVNGLYWFSNLGMDYPINAQAFYFGVDDSVKCVNWGRDTGITVRPVSK